MEMTVKGKKQIGILNAREKYLSSVNQNNWITISMEEKTSRKRAREIETMPSSHKNLKVGFLLYVNDVLK